MPRLRRLTGLEVTKILELFDFELVRVRGSHHIFRRVIENQTQMINVPVHGKKLLGPGLLKRLFRDLSRYVAEEELYPHFYS